MQLDQLLHQRQPDAAALEGSSARSLHAAETLEQVRQLSGRDARAGVMHTDLGMAAIRRNIHNDADLSREGELEGV
jgi:hypothetical protein